MTPFALVDIEPLVRWLDAIDFEEWPQQRIGELRPAMVTDPEWHGFGAMFGPTVNSLMRHFSEGTTAFQAMLSVVMPGHEIEAHRDEQAPYWVYRVHVPLTSNGRAWFVTGGLHHHMAPGIAYLVDTRVEHAVINAGKTPRTHFMFDVRQPC